MSDRQPVTNEDIIDALAATIAECNGGTGLGRLHTKKISVATEEELAQLLVEDTAAIAPVRPLRAAILFETRDMQDVAETVTDVRDAIVRSARIRSYQLQIIKQFDPATGSGESVVRDFEELGRRLTNETGRARFHAIGCAVASIDAEEIFETYIATFPVNAVFAMLTIKQRG